MTIEMQSEAIPPNESQSMSFEHDIFDFVLGIEEFKLSFSGSDHHVKEMSVSISANVSHNILYVTAHARLSDGSGHTIDNAGSYVRVSCVAVTQGSDNNVQLANLRDVNGKVPIDTPTSPSLLQGIASGFDLKYPGDDHHVQTVAFDASANATTSRSATLDGSALMHDDSNNWANVAEVNGGLVAASRSAEDIVSAQTGTVEKPDSEITLDLGHALPDGKKIDKTVAMIQAYRVSFGGSDHHVRHIGGGCEYVGATDDGTKVKVKNARAFIDDDSSHNQDQNDSRVNIVVFATVS